jgi:hypothetical protein
MMLCGTTPTGLLPQIPATLSGGKNRLSRRLHLAMMVRADQPPRLRKERLGRIGLVHLNVLRPMPHVGHGAPAVETTATELRMPPIEDAVCVEVVSPAIVPHRRSVTLGMVPNTTIDREPQGAIFIDLALAPHADAPPLDAEISASADGPEKVLRVATFEAEADAARTVAPTDAVVQIIKEGENGCHSQSRDTPRTRKSYRASRQRNANLCGPRPTPWAGGRMGKVAV